MLQHYVFLKYQPGTAATHVAEFKQRLLALRTTVPGIAQLEIGEDVLHDARSWDLLLIMRFADVESLRRYQQHPEHLAVMAFNQPFVAAVGSVDFFA